MKKVRVGLIGSGFIAELHMHAYRRVYGVDVEVVSVASRGDHVVDDALPHRFRELLNTAKLADCRLCRCLGVHYVGGVPSSARVQLSCSLPQTRSGRIIRAI